MKRILFLSIALMFASGAAATLNEQAGKRKPMGADKTYPPVIKSKLIPKRLPPKPTPTPTPTPKP